MTQREIYEQKTEELILPILEELQFELVDVCKRRRYLVSSGIH